MDRSAPSPGEEPPELATADRLIEATRKLRREVAETWRWEAAFLRFGDAEAIVLANDERDAVDI